MSFGKIRLLYIIETLGMGGAERLIVNVLKNIDRNVFSPYVACLFDKRQIEAELSDAGIPVICLALPNQYHWQMAISGLSRLMKRERFDIVHTHLFFANIYGRIAAKMSGVKNIITTLHNPDYTFEVGNRFTWRLRKTLDKYSGMACNRLFLAVSESVKKDFERHLGYKNIDVFYNCVDTEKFMNLPENSRGLMRSELGLKNSDIAILNVGRLHPQKGQLSLLRALRFLRDADDRYKLLMVGRGPMSEQLKEETRRLNLGGSVVFLQDRSDVPQIMSACDIFAFPSLYEGFGIALVEAMASGLSVVATGLESIKEIMRENIDGLFIEKDNPGMLAQAIRELAQNPRKMAFYSQNARRRVIEEFSLKKYLNRLEALYQGLASGLWA